MTRRVLVVFRNDDPSARSDVEHERRVAAVFERHRLPQTLGVVPEMTAGSIHDPTAGDVCALLPGSAMARFLADYADRSGSEIALHGLTHRTSPLSIPSRREYFEFRVHSAAEQAHMIARGSEVLSAALRRRPTTFIPPWNRLDANTLIACRRTGFAVVSAGPYTAETDGLLPCGTDSDLRSFPRALMRLRDSGRRAVLKVLYHSRSIRTDEDWTALEQAAALAASTPECLVLTIHELAVREADLLRRANRGARGTLAVPAENGPAARATIYRRALRDRAIAAPLRAAQVEAAAAYETGDYDGAARAAETLDGCAWRVLAASRIAVTMAAGLAGWLAGTLLGPPAAAGVYAAAVAATALATAWAWKAATAPDTRREIVTAALCSGGGVSAGRLLALLLR